MQVGATVKITEGPFAGLLGRFVSESGQRALVVVETDSRQFDVEMALDWIVATGPERKAVSSVGERRLGRLSNT